MVLFNPSSSSTVGDQASVSFAYLIFGYLCTGSFSADGIFTNSELEGAIVKSGVQALNQAST